MDLAKQTPIANKHQVNLSSRQSESSARAPQITKDYRSKHGLKSKDDFTSTSTISSASSLLSSFDSYADDLSGWLNESVAQATASSQAGRSSIESFTALNQHLQDLTLHLHLDHAKATSQATNHINQLTNSVPRLSGQIQDIATSARRSLNKLNVLQQQSQPFTCSHTEIDLIQKDRTLIGNLHGIGEHQRVGRALEEAQVSLDRQQFTRPSSKEAEVSRSLEKLAQLSRLSQRLQESRNVLRDAEKWSSLSFDVKSALRLPTSQSASGPVDDFLLPSLTSASNSNSELDSTSSSEPDLILASQHLSSAQSSLSFFPNSKTRSELLDELLEIFQGIVRSKLVSVLKERPIDRDLAVILRASMMKIGRERLWLDWWMEGRSDKVRNDWNQVRLLEELTVETEKGYRPSLKDWIPNFWNEVLSLLNEQKLLQSSMDESRLARDLEAAVTHEGMDQDGVGESPGPPSRIQAAQDQAQFLMLFLQYILENLNPTLSERIWSCYDFRTSNMTKSIKTRQSSIDEATTDYEGGLDVLVAINESIKDFSGSFDQILRKVAVSKNHAEENQNVVIIEQWQRKLFEPVSNYLKNYSELERNELESSFRCLLPEGPQAASHVKLLSESSLRWFESRSNLSARLARASISRTNLLTLTFKSASNAAVIDSFLAIIFTEDVNIIKSFIRSLHDRLSNSDLVGRVDSADEEIDWESFKLLVQLLDLNQKAWTNLEDLRAGWLKERTPNLDDLRGGFADFSSDKAPAPAERHKESTTESNSKKERLRNELRSTADRFGVTEGYLAFLMKSLDDDEDSPVKHRDSSSSSQVSLSQFLPQTSQVLLLHLRYLHESIQTILLSPVLFILENYPSLPQWSSNSSPASTMRNEYELNLPSFSLSNTEEMHKLIENCLNLPRLLEWGLGGDGGQLLGFGSRWLKGGEFEKEEKARKRREKLYRTSPSGNRRKSLLGGPTTPSTSNSTSTRSHLLSSEDSVLGTAIDLLAPGESISKDLLLPVYLRSLLDHLLSHLTFKTLPQIRTLSANGKNQLKTDLEGFNNILEALGMVEERSENQLEPEDDDEVEESVNDSGFRDEVGSRSDGLRRFKNYREILDLDEEVSKKLFGMKNPSSIDLASLARLSLDAVKRSNRKRTNGEDVVESGQGEDSDPDPPQAVTQQAEDLRSAKEMAQTEEIEREVSRLAMLKKSKALEPVGRMRGWGRNNEKR